MLFVRQAAELDPPDTRRCCCRPPLSIDPRADRAPVAPRADQTHVQIIPEAFLRTEHADCQQVAWISAAAGDNQRHPAVAKQIREVDAVRFPGDRQAGGECHIVESAAVALKHRQRLDALDARAAIPENDVLVAVVIDVAGVAAHAAPAAGDASSRLRSENVPSRLLRHTRTAWPSGGPSPFCRV